MGTILYVTRPGACVHQMHGRLRVTVRGGKELLQEIRLEEVERVVLVGGATGLTSPAAACLMEAGIETAFLSSTGAFRGYLSPARRRGLGGDNGRDGIAIRLAQFTAFHHPQRRLDIARAIVGAKIKSGDVLLARFARNHPDFDPSRERRRLVSARAAAQAALSTERLLGHEGAAAVAYFAAFGRMLGGGFAFSVRSRRPPRDPANALLSFGYTLLSAEATGAVAGAGLDPALGMLHSVSEGRPSLALDLTEEFRQAVVDRLVLHLANNRVLSPTKDFEAATSGTGATQLTDAARRTFLLAYETRMTEPFQIADEGESLAASGRSGGAGASGGRIPAQKAETCLRDRLRAQAQLLARSLVEDRPYVPFTLR